MASSTQCEDERWDQMTESIDLLFARMGGVERVQSQMAAQLDRSTQIMDQLLRDQNTLAKQMDTTGKTVSNLAQQFSSSTQAPYSRQRVFPADSSSSGEPPVNPSFPAAAHRHAVPKMSFPKFTGANPTIWRDKCLDYFHIFNIPETLWTPTTAMNMDDNVAST